MGLTGGPVLVLGGTGLVGARLAAALRDTGAEVRAVGREVDVTDHAAVDRAVAGSATVFHLAGPSVGDAHDDPVGVLEANVMGTVAVLDACRRHAVARVLVAGSLGAYRSGGAGPLAEEAPLEGRDPYAASKACADLATRAYAASFGLPATVVRLANVYGPGDRHASRLVPGLLAAVRSGQAPQLRSDGSPWLDLVYVDDAVAGLLAAARAADGAARGLALNVGGGRAHTVREITETVLELAGASAAPVYGAPPAQPAVARWLDLARMRALTGWAPEWDLRAGLRATLDAAP